MRRAIDMLCRVVAGLIGIETASAACQSSEVTGISFTGATLAAYNPFTSYPPKTVGVTINAAATCSVELAFQVPNLPPRMTGPGSLAYDITTMSGATSLVYAAGLPATTTRVDVGPGLASNTTVQVNIAPGQVVADGNYGDPTLLAQVFDKSGPTPALLKTFAVPLQGFVARACHFGTSSTTTMNFSSAIHNGLPNPGFVQSVTFQELSCTAPSIVRLTASPMQLAVPPTSSGAFDSQIHVRARATFGGANADLDTSAGAAAASVSRHIASGASTNGSVRLDVNLLRGGPLLPGTYTTTLTLSIDPNP